MFSPTREGNVITGKQRQAIITTSLKTGAKVGAAGAFLAAKGAVGFGKILAGEREKIKKRNEEIRKKEFKKYYAATYGEKAAQRAELGAKEERDIKKFKELV